MFVDRKEAGRQLADRLLHSSAIAQANKVGLLVLSIPRGGVLVGDVVAKALQCKHDVVVVKKIGLPGREELAIGAVAEDGQIFLDKDTISYFNPRPEELRLMTAQAKAKVTHYIQTFRNGKPLDLKGKTVILVDDGVATGETMKAALRWANSQDGENRAKEIIVAVPVCSPVTVTELRTLADEVITLDVPPGFMAVGQFYQCFNQVTDEEVLAILTGEKSVSYPAI